MVNWSAIGSVILPNIGNMVNGVIFAGHIRPKNGEVAWIDTINKPRWIAPTWVYGPAWTAMYCSMGYASYLVWEDCGGFTEFAKEPLALYGAQLALTWAWNPVLFGLKSHSLAFTNITLLSAVTLATCRSFGHINPTAGYLLLPYLAWLSYLTALSYSIWRLNPEGPRVTEIKDDLEIIN